VTVDSLVMQPTGL